MRRLALIAVLVAGAAGALAAFAFGFGGTVQGSGTSTFDVIFDDARGLIAGQLVKVAGAQAGTIQNVGLTADFKARITASIDSQFMPFRANATCTIRPQGLIAENYIDCNPGSPPAPALRSEHGFPPTVPVQNTTEPVSLLDLFNIFNLPTRERFSVIVNELGIGTAGEGGNINAILRRANPTLALADRVIGILQRQRSQLATVVDATNKIAAEGAGHTADVQNFLDRAAALSSLTASHSSNLALAINRLPGLLAAAQPALAQLDTVAVDGTPLLQQIRASVPALNRVSNDLGPFVQAAKPALSALSSTLKKGIPAIEDTTPLVKTLADYTARSLPSTELAARLFANLQQHGFVENFLSVLYYNAAALAQFDSTSHLLTVLLIGPDNGTCGNYATKPVAACSAHYGSGPKYKSSKARSARASRVRVRTGSRARARPAPRSGGSGAATGPTGASGSPSLPKLPVPLPPVSLPPVSGGSGTTDAAGTLQTLLNYLVH